ncbi:1,4-beta-xylanase, partial [Candidatus Peregrinibacteria bacterium]|nr:1,4-beta-xylanase [Candidatus Peregrinibacteria bacterium]
MQENAMKFTTSWDDGCALDMRVADILTNAGCTGTFYVCPHPNRRETLLSDSELRELAGHH